MPRLLTHLLQLLSANADALGDAIVAALASGLSQITLSTAFAKSDLASMLTRVGIRVAFADRAAATAIVPSLLIASAAGRTQLASSRTQCTILFVFC